MMPAQVQVIDENEELMPVEILPDNIKLGPMRTALKRIKRKMLTEK